VPEDRAKSNGRTVALNTVILPAMMQTAKHALFIFQGGPGQAATPLAAFYSRIYRHVRHTHDVVLIDQRGTGKSNALNCDISAGTGLFPVDAIARCAAESLEHADPKLYTTNDAVRDIEDARAVLAYPQI